MKLLSLVLVLFAFSSFAQFDPAGGQAGSKSIHKDASSIAGWANAAAIKRGFIQISDTALGKATVGDESSAIGATDGLVVSLGDGGEAVLSFAEPIVNRKGSDFAVFENGFAVGLSFYLELAHVEVSKNGIDYVRFPSETISDTSYQIDNFGYLKPTEIHNLAGKHQAPYGTLFDLEEIGLDIINYIKVIDVIGSINPMFGSRDSKGKIINDPYPSPFASGGFDLDAIAVVNGELLYTENLASTSLKLFPNRVAKNDLVEVIGGSVAEIVIYNALGEVVFRDVTSQFSLPNAGMYYVQITQNVSQYYKQLCVY